MSDGWGSLRIPSMDALPRRIVMRSQYVPARHSFADHAHDWHQLIYAISGTLMVMMAGARYVITPQQAMWIPKGVLHTTGTLHGSVIRSLYVEAQPGLNMPEHGCLLTVSPLMKALIIERTAVESRPEPEHYVSQIDDLILAQLPRQGRDGLSLPWPESPALRTLCQTLYDDPADETGMEDWGKRLGASSRTLARRFEKELGTSLRDWRQQLRLFRAVEWLAAGRSITDTALDLGYASPSAFTFMFRTALGVSPSRHRRRTLDDGHAGAEVAPFGAATALFPKEESP